jgi:peptidoglycan/xylan/chitin deacetylase (PgdA/CDA1 family)
MTVLHLRARRRASAALRAALLAGVTLCAYALPALAADCPGNPDALGTSRTLVVDPREHPRIGTMQYAEMLPLQAGEVVLTFDDGPLPKHSNVVLDLLKAECVKATFFVVGEMVRAHPEGVRRMRDEGHTVGTHSESHPLSMHRMPIEKARQQIDDGIADTTKALGEPPAPFFRIPGLLRADAVEEYLASQGLQTWSADFPADDWHKISPEKVHALAMSRLAAKGKGVILLHDIQGRTATALPAILRDLKAGGYKIVHVVPAGPDLPKTPTDPQQWREHPISEQVAIRRWPVVPRFAFADNDMLSAPSQAWTAPEGVPLVLPRKRNQMQAAIPIAWRYTPADGVKELPAPDLALFARGETTAPTYRVAIAIPRPPQLPPAAVAATAAALHEADGIGRLIAETADPTVTGSIAEAPKRHHAPHGVRRPKPRGLASVSLSAH